MRLFFLRRQQHRKLDERSDGIPGLGVIHPTSEDDSSGQRSVQSFDPTWNTHEGFNFAESPKKLELSLHEEYEIALFQKDSEKPLKSCRGWISGANVNKASHDDRARMLSDVMSSDGQSKYGEEQSKDLAEFDETFLSLRARGKFGNKAPVAVKAGGTGLWGRYDGPWALSAGTTKQVPRQVTWGRRVSSLEACFRRDTTANPRCTPDTSIESVILRVMPLDADGRKPQSTKAMPSSLSNDPLVESNGFCNGTNGKKNRKKSFQEQLGNGVSEIVGKLAAKGVEMLHSVAPAPDCSAGSSSGEWDFQNPGSSDDDDTVASGPRPRRRRLPRRHHRRPSPSSRPSPMSVSSDGGDDDDDDDEDDDDDDDDDNDDDDDDEEDDDDDDDDDDTTGTDDLGGCSSSQPYTTAANEIRTIFSDILSRRCSFAY